MASALDDIFGLSTRRNPFDLSGDTFSATGRAPSTDPSDGPNTGTVTPLPPPVGTGLEPPMGRTQTPPTTTPGGNGGVPLPSSTLPDWSTLTPEQMASMKTNRPDMQNWITEMLNKYPGQNVGSFVNAVNSIYGLQSGSGAQYYGAGTHGAGSAETIGLPGGYFAHANNDPNGAWQWVAGGDSGAAGGSATSGSTASNDIYTNAILSRLTQLGQPVDDPFRNLLLLSALGRSNDLMTKAPYTGQEDAALVAQYMNPLTQTRDTLRQQALERAGARGYLPSSGLLGADYQNIDKNYERDVAGASNDLAVKAVQQRQTNQDQAVNILNQVEQLAQSGRAEDRQRAIDMINTAKMLPDFDAQKLNELLQASGNGSDATSFLNSLFGANSSALNASGQNADAWGKFLGAILNSPALMSSIFGN